MVPSVNYFKNYFSELNNVDKTPDFDQTTALPIGRDLLCGVNKTKFIDCDGIAAPPRDFYVRNGKTTTQIIIIL